MAEKHSQTNSYVSWALIGIVILIYLFYIKNALTEYWTYQFSLRLIIIIISICLAIVSIYFAFRQRLIEWNLSNKICICLALIFIIILSHAFYFTLNQKVKIRPYGPFIYNEPRNPPNEDEPIMINPEFASIREGEVSKYNIGWWFYNPSSNRNIWLVNVTSKEDYSDGIKLVYFNKSFRLSENKTTGYDIVIKIHDDAINQLTKPNDLNNHIPDKLTATFVVKICSTKIQKIPDYSDIIPKNNSCETGEDAEVYEKEFNIEVLKK